MTRGAQDMKRLRLIGMILGWILCVVCNVLAQDDIGDYLIVRNTGDYEVDTAHRIRGNSGILIMAGHFFMDHIDTTYKTGYYNFSIRLGVEVQVTQHVGSDSDKWLLHEVDRDFRTYYGLPGDNYVIREMDGNIIMAVGSGGWTYRWLSGNKVIQIGYTDLQMVKPEPLEIVSAYLSKHSSTLLLMNSSQLRTVENESNWIKDEMERRLWLCDKWFLQVQMGKVGMIDALQTIVKCLNVFLDYRDKYYGMTAKDEKTGLYGYLNAKDGTSIKNKLADYKSWWNLNKKSPINRP
jgi:hypothetical protein